MFQVYLTEDILTETLYWLRKNNPLLNEEQVGGIRRRLIRIFGDDSVITGYTIDESLSYRDVFDAHVHCAAVHGTIDMVLTANSADFDFADADELSYEVYSPDEFFQLIDDSNPRLVRQVTEEQMAYWVRRSGKALPGALRDSGTPGFAERVRVHLQSIDVREVLGSA
ncbi:hypothetical protein NRB20_70680 [Nocardia sp. RB20]|uniref:PIN domain-containing protein n=2 Tax=Nocardia macrotermitis TaxID=2585198 RepID=A0A7K0DDP9_9NOCA|nr:hypothetical protein [Nocardia macrotermitis]